MYCLAVAFAVMTDVCTHQFQQFDTGKPADPVHARQFPRDILLEAMVLFVVEHFQETEGRQ